MSEIILTNSQVSIVEDACFEHLQQWSWHPVKGNKTTYARTWHNNGRLWLHKEVLKFKGICVDNLQVDHKNGDGLLNTYSNLRVATASQNSKNRRINENNSSGVKGVYWNKRRKKWHCQIRNNTELIHLGFFDNKISAAIAYNHAAKQLFGEFAWLNEIPDPEPYIPKHLRRNDGKSCSESDQ